MSGLSIPTSVMQRCMSSGLLHDNAFHRSIHIPCMNDGAVRRCRSVQPMNEGPMHIHVYPVCEKWRYAKIKHLSHAFCKDDVVQSCMSGHSVNVDALQI